MVLIMNVKIGDSVILSAPSGASRTVIVTDVIRDCFDRKTVLAIEFDGVAGRCSLPAKYFKLA